VDQEVQLNVWLQQQGYLLFQGKEPKNLEDMAVTSQAFALDPGRIYFNRETRFKNGCISEKEIGALQHDITNQLLTLEYQGKKVIKKVYKKEELYSGHLIDQGPDLIIQSYPGFDLKASLSATTLFGPSFFSGMHTREDAFCFGSMLSEESLHIDHVAQMILRHY
jgi:predicted AlkP superfamily phosphohydrolase/phosphomutase